MKIFVFRLRRLKLRPQSVDLALGLFDLGIKMPFSNVLKVMTNFRETLLEKRFLKFYDVVHHIKVIKSNSANLFRVQPIDEGNIKERNTEGKYSYNSYGPP